MRLYFLALALLCLTGQLEAKRRGASGNTRQEMLANNRPSKLSAREMRERLMSSTCDDCKAVVQKVRVIADNPLALDEAKIAIQTVCRAVLSGDELQECLKLADNLKAVIERFKPLIDNPELFCEQIYLCGSEEERSRIANIFFMAVKRQVFKMPLHSSERNAICDECKFALSEMKTVWDQKVIQRDAEEALESVCSKLGQYRDTCKDLIDQYWPTIVQFIDDELGDPDAACSSIGLCATRFAEVRGSRLFDPIPAREHKHPASSRSAFFDLARRLGRTQTAEGNRASCAICVFGVTGIIDSIKEEPSILNGLAADIEKGVDSVFPSEWGVPVNDFLSRYLVPVLQLTVEQVSPKAACSLLHICPAHSFVPSLREVEELRHEEGGNELVCESCRVLSAAIKDELEQPDVQRALQQEIDQICDVVPGQYSQECDDLVRDRLPEIIRLLANYADPQVLCPELGLCPSASLLFHGAPMPQA